MSDLASLGLVLLCALLAGHLVKFVRLPEVTGYIVMGALLGPSALGWIGKDNVEQLAVFSEVALGLILFSIGSNFEIGKFRTIGPRILRLAAVDALVVANSVALMMRLAGLSWSEALLLGIIATETAAASTLMVMRECNADGPLSETLLSFLAINNVFCLILFATAMGLLQIRSDSGIADAIVTFVLHLVWQVVGSVALGYLVGYMLSVWSDRATEHGEMLILIAGSMLLTVGAAMTLGLSPLIASLVVGATSANLAQRSERLVAVLGRTDPPFYAIFFVIAGANLHLAELKATGMIGLLYVVVRAAGKLISARFSLPGLPKTSPVRSWAGASMLSHAGLAVGLVLAVNERLPSLAASVSTIVLAAVLVYELTGPVLTRLVIVRSGEAHPEVTTRADLELT